VFAVVHPPAGTLDEDRMMRRAVLSLGLGAVLAASLFVGHGQAEVPLAVSISALRMAGPGQVGFDVAIAGLRPAALQTIEGTAMVGGRTIRQAPLPPYHLSARFPIVLDLPGGRILVGGDASVGEFPPLPPLEENMTVAFEITVRQGDEVATAHQTGALLLPTIIVPGYLNELEGKLNPGILSVLEQRGYRATGLSPSVFWFPYNSRGLTLEAASQALAVYVRETVLPTTYAGRINVVGYSLGGLLARWNMAFEPGWDHLVNRFVMVGVPNEGAVTTYVYAWYLLGNWARTAGARAFLPTFPFWRPSPEAPWGLPPDAQNPELTTLNSHPLPGGTRAYAFYGTGPGTWAGITGQLPEVGYLYGPGDGITLAASALGLPIHGGAGVPGLADRLVMQIDLGAVGHGDLLWAALPMVAGVLVDRWTTARSNAPAEREEKERARPITLLPMPFQPPRALESKARGVGSARPSSEGQGAVFRSWRETGELLRRHVPDTMLPSAPGSHPP
jgi:hypothetical protein